MEVGLELVRKHVVCPVSDWFQHEYHVRVTLHNTDLDADADHDADADRDGDGDADRDGDGDGDGNGHDEGDGDGEGGGDGDGFHVHSVRYHLTAHDLGPGFHVQNFGHYFPVRKFGFEFQVQNFGNSQGPLAVSEYRKGFQWPGPHDGSQVGLEHMTRVQWLDIHPQADLLDASGDWTRYASFRGDVGICSCFRSLCDLADSSGRSMRGGVYVYWKTVRDVRK